MEKAKIPITYCEAVLQMKADNPHKIYHNTAYGFPIESDNELFGRLILEINQAGLSWTTILNKEKNFRNAYHQFDIETIASYREVDFMRLMADAGIIRNRLKILAAIENAKTIKNLQLEYGSFKNWLCQQHPLSKEQWTKLFKKTFRFTGGEIVNEFLMSTGFLPGAHSETCPVYLKIIASKPAFLDRRAVVL